MGDDANPAMKPTAAEQAVFAEALLRDTPEARLAYLDSACGADAALRQRVEALLRAAEYAGDFLETPPTGLGDAEATLDVGDLSEKLGDKIGRYKLLQQIGEGGCGVVYMAEQEEPVRRRVALKVIKLGMDTKSVIARFEAERQALALMDHSNIAKVLDAGATENGRPYFVMELVRGIKITDFCDENNLPTEERLKLFTTVCHAIQHAHQKGIIHRDIKPSNILVTQNEKEAVPKVIDFGIAKATTNQRLTDKTVFTAFEQFIGTPAYMSPEQAMMTSLDIDTRTDIYALGVLLYELLTGTTPFDANELMAAGLDAMRRTIREVEPAKPSTRLTQAQSAAPTVSGKSEIRNLKSEINQDLDWIVMKCLEKDRTRRYETADGLATDIERHLSNEPVVARPPSPAYRFQKLVRRNKLAFAAAIAVTTTLVLGVLGSSWQAVRATRAKAVALAEKRRADQEAATAKQVTSSLQEMLGLIDPDAASHSILSLSAVRLQVLFGLVDPKATRGADYTLLQLVDDFADNLENKLADQPAAAADLHATIGRAYACRGALDKAKKHLARALALGHSVYGDQHEKYADLLVDYSRPDGSDPADYRAREADLRRALAIYRARGVGGEPVIRALWVLQWNLGQQISGGATAKQDQVEPVLNEALAEAAKSPEVEFPKIASIYSSLSRIRLRQSRAAEAEQIARKALALHLKSHPASLETGWGYTALSAALRKQGKFTEALVADRKALAMMRDVLPPQHANIAYTLSFLITTLEKADGAHALASLFPTVAELGEVTSIFQEVLETTKPSTLRYDDPAYLAARGLAQIAVIYWNLGREWDTARRTNEAEASRREANLLLQSLPDRLARNAEILPYVYNFGAVAFMTTGEPQQAKELFRKLLNQKAPKTCELQNEAAWFLATAEIEDQRDPVLATELATAAVAAQPQADAFHNTLGVARYRAGDWQQAIAELDKSIALSKGGSGFDFFFLAMAHWQLGNKSQARKWFDQAVAWTEKHEPKNEELRRYRFEAEKLFSAPKP